MLRRAFLATLAAVVAAPFVPRPKPQRLVFHPDAFSLVMADADIVRDPETGISIRFVRSFRDLPPTRFDVIYGWATPNQPVRIRG